ncbi:phage virion morphogenesis protein [Rhodobacter capsulatus]|nr:phage virion morphogenesis protein [Rhodobacter capsulatus]WER10632.1 phage virion morphogenesis protein [Rhodobacter capsulatus]
MAIPSHSIRIPARPYLGIGKGQEEIIAEDVEDWLSK